MKTTIPRRWWTNLTWSGAWVTSLLASALVSSAEMTNYVTTAADSGPGSLRQAILEANYAGSGTIVFSNLSESIVLATNLPALAGRISIVGPGTNFATISAGQSSLLIETQAVVRFRQFAFSPDALTIYNHGSVVFSRCVMPTNLVIWNQGRLTLFQSLQYSNRGPLTVFGEGTTVIHDQHYQGIDLTGGELQLVGCSSANRVRRGGAGGQTCIGSPYNNYVLICTVQSGGNGEGGGVFVASGTLAMTGCSITNNQVWGGDGIDAESGLGGGIFLRSGNLRMTNCTVSGNSARGGVGHPGYRTGCSSGNAAGAGVFIAGDATMVNSTISGNKAEPGAYPTWNGVVNNGGCAPGNSIGAGVALNGGVLRILQCTITENVAVPGVGGWVQNYMAGGNYASGIGAGGISGSGIYVSGLGWISGRVLVQNSIVAGNLGASNIPLGTDYAVTPNDALGQIESAGNNLFGTTNPIAKNINFSTLPPQLIFLTGLTNSDLVGPDHGLGPLQDNGGPTWTHALLPGSPAIDAAVNLGWSRDQRGRPRTCDSREVPNSPGGDGTDIGAFELEQSLCFTEVQRVGNHIQLTFPSTTGRSYFIEHSVSPTGGSWQRLPGVVAGTGSMVSYLHTNAAVLQNCFYRVAESVALADEE